MMTHTGDIKKARLKPFALKSIVVDVDDIAPSEITRSGYQAESRRFFRSTDFIFGGLQKPINRAVVID